MFHLFSLSFTLIFHFPVAHTSSTSVHIRSDARSHNFIGITTANNLQHQHSFHWLFIFSQISRSFRFLFHSITCFFFILHSSTHIFRVTFSLYATRCVLFTLPARKLKRKSCCAYLLVAFLHFRVSTAEVSMQLTGN